MDIRFFLPYVAGAVLMVSPGALCGQAPPSLRLTRDLRIDAAEQDLSRIMPPGGLAVAPNGKIVVSQNQDGTIRFFDVAGGSLGAFGRKGQGPGEFQTIGRFTWIGDTLVVTDLSTRRFTLVSPDRKLIRTVPWLQSVSAPTRSSGEAPRLRVAAPRHWFADGSQLLNVSLATGSPEVDWPGGSRPGVPFMVVDSSGAFQRLIAWSVRAVCTAPFDAGAGMGSGNLGIPFCAQTLEEVSPEGSLMALSFVEPGSTPAFHVTLLRTTGDTVFTRSYRYQPVAIPRASIDSAKALRLRGSASQREAAAKMTVPETFPPVDQLVVGRDGSVWIQGYGPGAQRFWTLFDVRGNPVGRAAAPRNAQIMAGSRDALWAIETDDDGLQHIVRYRVSGQ